MTELLSSARDVDTSGVPFAITNRRLIPAQRYYDKDFFELEKQKLWPHVWQNACRLEEIPNVGDFVEYWVADQSVIVVRTSTTEIKAYQNACRHRATQLAVGCGTFRGGQIVCPFHGWRWNLDGTSSFVLRPRLVPAGVRHRRRSPPRRVPGGHVGELRVHQHGSRRAAPAAAAGADAVTARPTQRGADAGVLVEGGEAEGELEAGHGGVHGGLPRSPDPSPAHLRGRRRVRRRRALERRHLLLLAPERPRALPGVGAERRPRRGHGKADEPPVFMADAAATMSERQIAELDGGGEPAALRGPRRDGARQGHARPQRPPQHRLRAGAVRSEDDRSAVRVEPRRRHPVPGSGSRRAGALGWRVLHVPELLHPPRLRQRARCTASGPTPTIPSRATSSSGRTRCTPRVRSRESRRSAGSTRRTTRPNGRSSRVRTSATSSVSSAASTRKACTACGRPRSSRTRSPTCTRISTRISRSDRRRR